MIMVTWTTLRTLLETYHKPLLLSPFLVLNGTLSLIESIQRYIFFDNSNCVGYVKDLGFAPFRSSKLTKLKELDVKINGIKHQKCLSVYTDTVPKKRVYPILKHSCALTNIVCNLKSNGELTLSYPKHPDLTINLSALESSKRLFGISLCHVKNDGREYVQLDADANDWISNILGVRCVFMFLPTLTLACEYNWPVYTPVSKEPAPTAPIHITAISSLDDINRESGTNLDIERFRANIVVGNSKPHDENTWKVIRVGDTLELEQTFLNPRCAVVNSLRGELNNKVMDIVGKSDEIIKNSHKVACFGHFWKVLRPGKVQLGDEIVLLERMKSVIMMPDKLTDAMMVG